MTDHSCNRKELQLTSRQSLHRQLPPAPVLKIALLVLALLFLAVLGTGGYLYFSGRWADIPEVAKLFTPPSTQRVKAAKKTKRVSNAVVKDQRITVTAIDANNNGCGNRMGSFDAIYRGKKIGIIFTHSKVQSDLDLCATPGEKLSFLNKPIDVVGNWSGKDNAGVDQFDAKEIFLSGKNRKVTPSIHRDTAYLLSAKITNNEHEMRVLLNNKEVVFKDNTPQVNCNRGQFVFKEYEASSVREMKLGNKIVTQGLDEKGIEQRADGPFAFAQNGSKTEVIAKNTGRAVLLLMCHGSETSNYCCIKYFIPFVITP